MRLLVSVFLLALSLPISSVLGAAARGEFCCDREDWECDGHRVACAEGLSCCYQRPLWMWSNGGTCYDPKTEACAECPVYNPNHPQTQVCPSSSPTCCGGCINSSLQCCHRYGSYDFFTCGADKTCCGFSGPAACCDSTQDCINDVCVPKQTATTLPPPAPGCVIPGDLKCGVRCYNPTTHVCTNPGTEFLCPVAYPNQCGTGCYSPTQYTCEAGQLKPVGSGVTQPPATTNQPPATQPPATQPPATQPPATQPPATQPPATQPPATAAPGCVMPGDLKCGTRCYNPSTHVCADAGSSFLCSPAFPSKCGDACYSPSQYKCENGQLKGL